ncbi:MAG: hypothetical protein BWY06_03461 [Candidatus Latescibacteria bacterium ADurb.Bin168]|nr:MAG: hypothetical protein BWY06_03461 [Candidatus Latescibacteria bacterium ADurb.Bin168]
MPARAGAAQTLVSRQVRVVQSAVRGGLHAVMLVLVFSVTVTFRRPVETLPEQHLDRLDVVEVDTAVLVGVRQRVIRRPWAGLQRAAEQRHVIARTHVQRVPVIIRHLVPCHDLSGIVLIRDAGARSGAHRAPGGRIINIRHAPRVAPHRVAIKYRFQITKVIHINQPDPVYVRLRADAGRRVHVEAFLQFDYIVHVNAAVSV